ncbi:TPA: hypothetical protein ACH3X2_008112 [Trebouxia sp. C0005]
MDQPSIDDVAPSGSAVPAADGTPQQLIDQLTQLLSVLQRAHGVLPGYDEIAARQSINQHHVQQLHSGQQLQQEQRDKWVAQELLMTQLTQQLAAYAEALDQLHNICQQQELRVRAIQTHASALQQQLGQKHKRIRELESDSLSKDSKIQDLEARLQKYRRLCSYVTANSQELEHQSDPRHGSPSHTTTAAMTTADTVTQGSSGPGSGSRMVMEVDVGRQQSRQPQSHVPSSSALLSTADLEETLEAARRQHLLNVNAPDSGMQELKGTPWLKRMPCLIIGRHAQLPREVLVVCKQITGSLLLNNVREELKVRVNLQGNQIVSPSEFEAAAGCSKGKNWKANIRVLGKNGSTQMLKVWLPGLMQLVGDHQKVAIAESDIASLLDAESGLRIQSTD